MGNLTASSNLSWVGREMSKSPVRASTLHGSFHTSLPVISEKLLILHERRSFFFNLMAFRTVLMITWCVGKSYFSIQFTRWHDKGFAATRFVVIWRNALVKVSSVSRHVDLVNPGFLSNISLVIRHLVRVNDASNFTTSRGYFDYLFGAVHCCALLNTLPAMKKSAWQILGTRSNT